MGIQENGLQGWGLPIGMIGGGKYAPGTRPLTPPGGQLSRFGLKMVAQGSIFGRVENGQSVRNLAFEGGLTF